MTPLLKFNTQSFFALDQAETRTLLDWFEAAKISTPGDLRMASKLYAFRGVDPPPRLKHLFEPVQERRILSVREMYLWLLDHRYKINTIGIWESPDIGLDLLPAMWAYCGGTDTGGYKWLPEWFEGEK